MKKISQKINVKRNNEKDLLTNMLVANGELLDL